MFNTYVPIMRNASLRSLRLLLLASGPGGLVLAPAARLAGPPRPEARLLRGVWGVVRCRPGRVIHTFHISYCGYSLVCSLLSGSGLDQVPGPGLQLLQSASAQGYLYPQFRGGVMAIALFSIVWESIGSTSLLLWGFTE